jgi:hypothetical protein
MKRAVAVIIETILFLAVFLVGSFLPVFHFPLWSVNVSATRYFVLDGPVLMLALYVLLLLIGTARHRLMSAVATSTLSIVLAFVLGLAMKFGFATR